MKTALKANTSELENLITGQNFTNYVPATSLYDVISAYVTAYVTVCVFPLVHVTQMWTVWITVLVALSRYVAICRPYQAPRLCTMRRVRQQVVAVAVAILVYNVPRFLEFRVEYVLGQVTSLFHRRLINVSK